ncbi:putative CENPB DNA-binding domain-containing protein 1 [Discoglossus pictus]
MELCLLGIHDDSLTSSQKRSKSIPLDVKIQVLDFLEKGEQQVDIGADLKFPTFTICTIHKNKEKIKSSATTSTAPSAKKITLSRCYALQEMEKKPLIWIDDGLECNMPLSHAIIMEKARSIYTHLQTQTPDVTESFAANRGWFDHFKKWNNLYSIKITREAEAAVDFPAPLKDIVERGNYPIELV